MAAPAPVPRLPSNPEPLPVWAQDLKIDPPARDGPQLGDPVYCWQGEAEPTDPLRVVAGFVTMVGHNRRVSVTLLPKDFVALVTQDSVVPHDDKDAKGKWPNAWRWKPAPTAVTVRGLEAKVAVLTQRLDDLVVSLAKPKP